MGQRQSSPEEQPSENNRRGRVIRPNSRATTPRHDPSGRETIRRIHQRVPTMGFVPVNDSQRREERRRRREFIREQLMNGQVDERADLLDSASVALGHESGTALLGEDNNQDTTATMTTAEGATITPFSRMIAQVISEAVVASFRNTQRGHQQLTMHLSPELFRQMEPQTTEDVFMRFIRLPVLVTSRSVPSSAADGETPQLDGEDGEVTRIMMLPVFLYGQRMDNVNNSAGTRSSARLRERRERERPGQWTVYIISGNSVETILSDSPSYEELLNLAAMIGPARRPTVSQEAIDEHLPLIQYTQQVKQTIVGNSEKCQVCLNSYQLEETIRILPCHHGFHKDCIDEWLTQGQNKCPLCRLQVIPTATSNE